MVPEIRTYLVKSALEHQSGHWVFLFRHDVQNKPLYQANSHIIVIEYFLPWFFLGSVSVNQHSGFDSKMSNSHRQFNELQ
jgi:hypothetical protein